MELLGQVGGRLSSPVTVWGSPWLQAAGGGPALLPPLPLPPLPPLPPPPHAGLVPRTQIPLNVAIREQADAGAPVVAVDPEGPAGVAYTDLASRVWAKVQAEFPEGRGGGAAHGPPKIVIE